MKTLKRLIIGITFSAVLAFSFMTNTTTAYAGGGNSQSQNTGQSSSPKTGGTFQALGITWE